MKVTIIGGSGFIGTRIVDHFTQFKGYDFRIVDIRDSHFFNDITTIGDVRNQQQMDSALAGTDLVILLAAQHRDNVLPHRSTTTPTWAECAPLCAPWSATA